MSEEQSQNQRLMNHEEVKLTWFQNIILASKVYVNLFPLRYQIMSMVIMVSLWNLGDWTEKDKPVHFMLKIIACLLTSLLANLIVFGLIPFIIQDFKENALPGILNHASREKVKLQKASIEKIDDIILKK